MTFPTEHQVFIVESLIDSLGGELDCELEVAGGQRVVIGDLSLWDLEALVHGAVPLSPDWTPSSPPPPDPLPPPAGFPLEVWNAYTPTIRDGIRRRIAHWGLDRDA